MTDPADLPRLPLPRWLIRLVWRGHRLLHRASRGRLGLRRPENGQMGLLRLITVGRRTGEQRSVILGYRPDGDSLVTLAMNGWDGPDPAWWLNLQAHPDAEIELVDGVRRVRARAAVGAERDRLWRGFADWSGWGDIDRFALRRPGGTAIVVFEAR